MVCSMVSCYGEKLLAPRPIARVEEHPWLSENFYSIIRRYPPFCNNGLVSNKYLGYLFSYNQP
jgi:hypothetical protein